MYNEVLIPPTLVYKELPYFNQMLVFLVLTLLFKFIFFSIVKNMLILIFLSKKTMQFIIQYKILFNINLLNMNIYILISYFIITILAAPDQDRVTKISIPNYNIPWYSGYLTVSDDTKFHYVFFMSQNKNTDPVLLWLNGGPGCSSLIGMVYQNGPFVFAQNTDNFTLNRYAWNKNANLLYIQSPGGVGFSTGSIFSSDRSVAIDNLKALKSFYAKFPQFKSNQLYLSGESYAGIYLPTLALQIINDNKKNVSIIDLKGFIVGNPCTHPDQCYVRGFDGASLFQYQFLWKHLFISDYDYMTLQNLCTDYQSTQCVQFRQIIDKKFQQTNTTIDNIYAKCLYQVIGQNHKSRRLRSYISCQDQIGSYKFFNQPINQKNLNVIVDDGFQWLSCNDNVYYNFTMDPNASYQYYPQLLRSGLKIWIYSGDVDANVPITGTLSWINRLKKQNSLKIMKTWQQWLIPGKKQNQNQIGGMIWRLQNITFVSIRGAGHMVPHDQPAAAYKMLESFLTSQGQERNIQRIQ